MFRYLQIPLFILVTTGLVFLLGRYMVKVFRAEKTLLSPLLAPLERLSYRLCRINPQEEMGVKKYIHGLLLFNFLGIVALFLIQTAQAFLPFNPENFSALAWPLALNTSVSFVTNTDWQAYFGESALSYTTQMLGLTVQNFLSAATGNAVLLALIRGFVRRSGTSIGNFWVDLTRTVIYLLLPLSVILALLLVSQGAVQTLSPYVEATTLEQGKQIIPLGPAASQIAIKQLGSNGGGFFGTNSAHPFENPTPFSNFLQLIAIIAIPAASLYMYGSLTYSLKHAWLLLLGMLVIWGAGLALSLYSEQLFNPLFQAEPLLEGKEVRFGVVDSLLWTVTTTATSNGSVNAMIESLSPLAGGVPLFNMMLGELIFGGVGVGLLSMLMFVLLTLFLAGLMVGRTPEYMGKKIEKREMQWVCLAVLAPIALILISSSLALMQPEVLSSLKNKGPHGLSTILYTYTSCSANNGSAFAGLNSNTLFYNLSTTLCMFLARLALLIPSLFIAGSLVQKKRAPFSLGILSTDTFLFLSLLLGSILIVGALSFFPALSLGPIVEHFLMLKGRGF